MVRLFWDELVERLREMKQNAIELKLYANVMYSTNPTKQEALDRIKKAVDEILECIDVLAEGRKLEDD